VLLVDGNGSQRCRLSDDRTRYCGGFTLVSVGHRFWTYPREVSRNHCCGNCNRRSDRMLQTQFCGMLRFGSIHLYQPLMQASLRWAQFHPPEQD